MSRSCSSTGSFGFEQLGGLRTTVEIPSELYATGKRRATEEGGFMNDWTWAAVILTLVLKESKARQRLSRCNAAGPSEASVALRSTWDLAATP